MENLPAENKSSVTVEDFDKLVEEMKLAYDDQTKKKATLTEANLTVARLESKCVAYLKELKRDNFSTPLGTPYMIKNWKVKNPESDIEKEKFFSWLEEKGGTTMRTKYTTVNNNSLNSLYKTMRKEAEEKGEMLIIPGLDAPSLHESLGWRKK